MKQCIQHIYALRAVHAILHIQREMMGSALQHTQCTTDLYVAALQGITQTPHVEINNDYAHAHVTFRP